MPNSTTWSAGSRCCCATRVEVGDRVVAWLPNRPETYAVMLACAGLGAVFASTSPDFGTDGVIDRFGQIEPTVLLSVPDYAYNGKRHDCAGRLDEIVRRCHLFGIDRREPGGSTRSSRHRSRCAVAVRPPVVRAVLVGHHRQAQVHRAPHRRCAAEAPDRTRFHSDLGPGDRVFYFTTAGWMMWNWLASGLAPGDAGAVRRRADVPGCEPTLRSCR